MAFIAGCAPNKPYTPPSTVKGLQNEYVQFNRAYTITQRILSTSLPICPKIRADYGFVHMSLTEKGDKKQRNLWIKAFNLQKQPTVSYIIPQSSADKAGLLVGDAIISINDNKWADAESQEAFTKQLHQALKSPHLRLDVRRDGKQQTLHLTADKVCDYSFYFVLTNRHLAFADDAQIKVDLGAAKLLKHDDELAFFIAHELAHLLLGHTLPDRKKELNDYKMRSVMEKDADALGIRLMVHAGYDPKAAETALKLTDLIDSGPVTNFFNYHGPYMPTDERIQYLRNILHQ